MNSPTQTISHRFDLPAEHIQEERRGNHEQEKQHGAQAARPVSRREKRRR